MRDNSAVKSIGIEGVNPSASTIKNKSYPLVAVVYAVIRKDLDPSSTAYRLYQYLQTAEGKNLISQSGYIPY